MSLINFFFARISPHKEYLWDNPRRKIFVKYKIFDHMKANPSKLLVMQN